MKIKEGMEYQIVRYPDKRIIFSGIAESDTEAEERLESYALYMRVNSNLTFTVTLKIEKL